MALLDRVGVACSTTGTSTLTLGAALGAVAPNLASFMTPAAAGGVDQQTYRYLILDSNGAWEIGRGLYSASGTTLTRNVLWSSNANAAINCSGNEQVFITLAAEDIIALDNDQTSLFTITQQAQARANIAGAPIEALAQNVLNLNAGMEVSQVNGTTAVTLTATSSLQTTYLVDGVMAAYRGTFVATAQQVTDAPAGFKNSVKFTVTTAEASLGGNDELSVLIPIEGLRCVKLAYGASGANALAVFFWTKVNRTGVYSGSLRNAGKTRSYPFNFTVINSNTWEYKSVLISTGDVTGTWAIDNTVGLYLNIAIAAGSTRAGPANTWAGTDYSGVTSTTNGIAATTDVFEITGVGALPLLSGVGACDVPAAAHSPFLVRPFPQELEFGERYYQKTYDYGTAPGTATYNGIRGVCTVAGSSAVPLAIQLNRRMRAAPTVSYWDGAGNASKTAYNYNNVWANNYSGGTLQYQSESYFELYVASAPYVTFIHYQADARL